MELLLVILVIWFLWYLFRDGQTTNPSRPPGPTTRVPPKPRYQKRRSSSTYYIEDGDNRALRRKLIKMQLGCCAYCGKSLPLYPPKGSWHQRNWDYPTIDHVVPQSRGGSHHISNLVAACWGCNRSKGNRVA